MTSTTTAPRSQGTIYTCPDCRAWLSERIGFVPIPNEPRLAREIPMLYCLNCFRYPEEAAWEAHDNLWKQYLEYYNQ